MRPISDEDIVISGISGRYPKSASLQEFWDNLTTGTEMYTEEAKRWTSSKNFFIYALFLLLLFVKCFVSLCNELYWLKTFLSVL